MGKNNIKQKAAPYKPSDLVQGTVVDNLTDRSKYVYEQISVWIENADNKVGISCGVFSGVFGIITFLSERYMKIPDGSVVNECWRYIYVGSFVISLVILAIAIYFYVKAIVPNLKSSGDNKTKKKYPIYFGDIAYLNVEEYKKLMENGTEKEFNDELIAETHFKSEICLKKMKSYKCGVILSMVAIGFAVLSGIAHFLMYRCDNFVYTYTYINSLPIR